MSIFDNLRVYAAKWAKTASREFKAEEIAAINKAVVVESDYGNSVCFFMKSGGRTYLPLSTESAYKLGDEVDLTSAKLITLSKSGEADINRVE